MEQFDDILRTFTNEMNKFENRFGKIRDEEKILAVKKLMPESFLNYRFRGTTMSNSELIVALENIIIDKGATVPAARGKKQDTSAPMEIGMAAREDSEGASQEVDQRIIDLALQAVYKGTGKGKWSVGKGGGKDGGKNSWQKAVARKEAKDKRKVKRERPELVGRVARRDTSQLGAGKEEKGTCMPWTKMTVKAPRKFMKVRKICRHGAYWWRAKVSSGRK